MNLRRGARPIPDCPDYVLVRKLGAGAFGEVWHARGSGGVEIALKFIRLDSHLRAVELRSLGAMEGIRHPNLVNLLGAWQVDNWLVLAMELCDRSLQDCLTETANVNLPGISMYELLNYISDAAAGLDALNAQQVQHRDIKPANLLLLNSVVKVADFGLAKTLEETLASNSGGGTIAYIAPECFKGKLAQQSDQYSLAVTYFHLRTGKLLFDGNQAEIMYAHLQVDPDLSMLYQDEAAILARALSKEPSKRWRTCRSFVTELIQATYPITSRNFARLSPSASLDHRDLHLAARDGNCDTLRAILAASPVRAEEQDATGRTPLDWSVRHWQWAAMRILLDSGARASGLLRPSDGWERALAVLTAVERDVIKLRYRIGAKVVYSHDEVGEILQLSPERVMVLEGEAVEKLRDVLPALAWLEFLRATEKHPPIPEDQDIHLAARRGDLGTVKEILTKTPGRKDEPDAIGRTPLAWAFGYHMRKSQLGGSHYAVMRLLIDEFGIKPSDPLVRLFEASRLRALLKGQRRSRRQGPR